MEREVPERADRQYPAGACPREPLGARRFAALRALDRVVLELKLAQPVELERLAGGFGVVFAS